MKIWLILSACQKFHRFSFNGSDSTVSQKKVLSIFFLDLILTLHLFKDFIALISSTIKLFT